MKRAKLEKRGALGQRAGSKRLAAWPIVVVVTCITSGLFLWKTWKTGETPSPAAARKTTAGNTAMASNPSLPEPAQDRALRSEQLQVAEKLLVEFPQNDDVVYLAGLVHNEQGDSEAAMKLWQRSLELDPTRADAHESLGHAWLLRDEYEKAEGHFRQALELDPRLQTARFRLAAALSQQGKFSDVISLLEKAGSLSAEAYRLLGDSCQHVKQTDKAKASFEAAIQLKPDFTEAYYGLSKACAQLGESVKASEYWEKFSTLKQQNDTAEREKRTRFAPLQITRKSVAQTHTDVGRVYALLGHTGEAEQLWLRATALDPENTICRLNLAVFYQRTGQEGEALRFYEEIARIDPSDALVHLNLGRVSLKLRQVERAERAFVTVVKLAPNQPEGHSALAQLYLQTNRNPAEAARLAEAAVQLAPEAPYLALLSEARARNGDRQGALAAINQAIDLQPGNGQYRQMREMLLGRK